MKRGYVDTPEGQVHYRTEGSGEPILLLHKAGLSSDEYTEMLPFLGNITGRLLWILWDMETQIYLFKTRSLAIMYKTSSIFLTA